jgi:hypothetical protein
MVDWSTFSFSAISSSVAAMAIKEATFFLRNSTFLLLILFYFFRMQFYALSFIKK